MKFVNVLIPLRESDVTKIRTTLKRRRFEFAERDYPHFIAKTGRPHVTVCGHAGGTPVPLKG